MHKKGKSCSKHHSVQDDPGGSKLKWKKMNRDSRIVGMKTVEEEIKHLKDHIMTYKQKV